MFLNLTLFSDYGQPYKFFLDKRTKFSRNYVSRCLKIMFQDVVVVVVVSQQIGGNLITNFFTFRLTSASTVGEVTFVSSTA